MLTTIRRRAAVRARSKRVVARVLGLALALSGVTLGHVAAASVSPAATHPTGTLKLASKTLKAGDSVEIGGEKFAPSDEVTIVLVGVAGRIELGSAPTDSGGAFHRTFVVPITANDGQYRLVAEAIDGDPVASLDVVVQHAAAAGPMEGMHGGAMHEGMPMGAAPSGEALALVRARSPGVTWGMRFFIIASLLAGAALLRRGSRISPTEDHR